MTIRRFEGRYGPHRLYVEGFVPSDPTGHPVLALGGAFDGSWIYRRLLRLLALRGHPAYAMNLRGYYKSWWKNVAGLSVADYLDDIASVRDGMRLGGETVLIGYSLSGPLMMAEAVRKSAAGVILYDPDPPAEALIEPPDLGRFEREVQFVPWKEIIEEMWGGPVTDAFYHRIRPYFEMTRVSGRAYWDLSARGISVDPGALDSPVLVIGTQRRNRSHDAIFRKYRASWFAFDGYSHGMILFAPAAELLGRFAVSWIERDRDVGQRRFFSRRNGLVRMVSEDGYRTLTYYTGWGTSTVRVIEERGGISETPMRKSGAGRVPGENRFQARFLLPASAGFEIVGPSGIDRPFDRDLYRPRGEKMALVDGEFHPGSFPGRGAAPRREEISLFCEELDHEFRVRIVLPRDHSSSRKYPVAIFNDGQNAWTDEGVRGGWHADATAHRLAREGRIADIVLVGVWCHPDRNRGYHPPPHGQADRYARFLAQTLLPFLRKQYGAGLSPSVTALIGASYGAIAAVYSALLYPRSFGLVGAMSYGYLPANPVRELLHEQRRLPFRKLYLDAGTRWSAERPDRDDNTGITARFGKLAEKKGMIPGFDLDWHIAEGDSHDEEAWRRRLPRCLEFFFKP